MIGAAVIDPDDQRHAVGEVGHPRIARHWQGRMRCRQRAHVEHFAIGCLAAVEIVAVPGRQALGAVVDVLLRHVGPPGNHIGLSDAVGAAALGYGVAERHDSRARRDAVFGIDAAGEFVGRGAVGQHKASGHGSRAPRRPDHRI